jgi:putative peptidoglycan lipid II flippase
MLGQILTRAFYARNEVRTPVRIAIAMVTLNLILNLTLIWPLREAGLAWSTAICAVIQSILMAIILHRRGVAIFNIAVLGTIMRVVVAAATMAVCISIVLWMWPSSESWGMEVARLAVLTAVGAIVIGGCAIALRMPEWRWAIGLSGPENE